MGRLFRRKGTVGMKRIGRNEKNEENFTQWKKQEKQSILKTDLLTFGA